MKSGALSQPVAVYDHRLCLARWQARFPEYDIPAGKPGVPEELYDVAKAENELGIRCRPVAETFVDMAVTLIELGMAKPKRSSNGVCNGF